jgi:Mrp family chromosome partitioning ATPase
VHAVLTSDRLRARIAELRANFEYVLIEAPPIKADSDAIYLTALADGVLLIVEPNFTPRQAAQQAKEDIEAANARLLGVVMNQRSLTLPERLRSKLTKRR